MDRKPLLQERPPAYVPSSSGYEYGQTYGTIPPPGYQQQPPPYSYPASSGYVPPVSVNVQPPVCPGSNYSSTYTIIQQPTAASVVVVGGCPACSTQLGSLLDGYCFKSRPISWGEMVKSANAWIEVKTQINVGGTQPVLEDEKLVDAARRWGDFVSYPCLVRFLTSTLVRLYL
ncbi:membrane protein BRI3 isoform X1 [Narcine bancroftii]|uniref:membrane protein BRI3 isoform X1 n=1 Tax=Narcine bancroftii TaxID=1343680 RepID=UPI00383133F4